MAVIVTHHTRRDNSTTGFMLGVILIGIFMYFLFTRIIPAWGEIVAPQQITIPGRIDVNIRTNQ